MSCQLPNPHILVRPARPEDERAVCAVDELATATLRQAYRPNAVALANREVVVSRMSRLVAMIDDQVVGTVLYDIGNGSVRLVGLGVHSDYRQRGVARAMVDALRDVGERAGAEALFPHTVKETGNVGIFEHLGFSVVSEEPDRFSESDAYTSLTDVRMEMCLPVGIETR